MPIEEFRVDDGNGGTAPIASLSLQTGRRRHDAADSERAEHFVRVDWLKTVPIDQAISEKGFFGNQNSAAKPRNKKWLHTVERLMRRFGVE